MKVHQETYGEERRKSVQKIENHANGLLAPL